MYRYIKTLSIPASILAKKTLIQKCRYWNMLKICVYTWFGSCFLDYSVAARGTPHQTDPVPGKPAGDLPFSELLGMRCTRACWL